MENLISDRLSIYELDSLLRYEGLTNPLVRHILDKYGNNFSTEALYELALLLLAQHTVLVQAIIDANTVNTIVVAQDHSQE